MCIYIYIYIYIYIHTYQAPARRQDFSQVASAWERAGALDRSRSLGDPPARQEGNKCQAHNVI